MTTHNTTATGTQIAGWLETTLKGVGRQIATARSSTIAAAFQAEADAINRCILELKTGGVQTDLEKTKTK